MAAPFFGGGPCERKTYLWTETRWIFAETPSGEGGTDPFAFIQRPQRASNGVECNFQKTITLVRLKNKHHETYETKKKTVK